MTLQDRLRQFMQNNQVSQGQVSKGADVSHTAISQWLQNKYVGNVDNIEHKIAAYLERELGKQTIDALERVLANTATTKRILNLLSSVHLACEDGLLYGNAGMGKTTALRYYAAQHPDVVLIEAMPTYTPAVVLKTIAKKIGVSVSGSLNDMNEAILAKLNDSGRMIIVDEAENLSTKSLEILRRLHDIAGVGLVLAGMPRLLSNLMGRHGELAQLHSRIGQTLDLPDRVADEELAEIGRVTLPQVSDTLLKNMVKRANGSPRRLWKIMYHCDRWSKQHSEPINADMVQAIDDMLLKN